MNETGFVFFLVKLRWGPNVPPLHRQVPTSLFTVQVLKVCKTTRWNLLWSIILILTYTHYVALLRNIREIFIWQFNKNNGISREKTLNPSSGIILPHFPLQCDLTNFFTFLLAIWRNGPKVYGRIQKNRSRNERK